MEKRMLQEQLRAAERAEDVWQQAERRVEEFSARMEQVEQQGMTVSAWLAYRRFLPTLEQQAETCQEAWQQAEQTADEQRASFRQARQRTRILDNLAERQRSLHQRQQLLLEQQLMDELAVQAEPKERI